MYYVAMPATVNIRLNDNLYNFVQENIGERGGFDNVSEFVRHALRQEQERQESLDFLAAKRELQAMFLQDPADAVPLDADALRAELFSKS